MDPDDPRKSKIALDSQRWPKIDGDKVRLTKIDRDKRTSFTKCPSFFSRSSKLILKTGNGIIQTGTRIISSTFRPLIKKMFDKLSPILNMELKIDFQNSNRDSSLYPDKAQDSP